MLERSYAYLQLMRLDKPIGTFLLLWPTLWAVWLASDRQPDLRTVLVFVIGVVIMRAAGCVINDYADRHIDGHVTRTKSRPLATGRVSTQGALLLLLLLFIIALCLALTLNRFTLAIAALGAVLTILYPFTKRFFVMPQLMLGLTWSLGLLMAFSEVKNQLPPVAWLLYLAHICLTIAYDTMYAMVDRPDDVKIGVHSTAILFGSLDTLAIAIFQVLCLGLLIAVYYCAELSWPFVCGLIGSTLIFIYQQLLLRHRDRDACLQAFRVSQWVGIVVLVGIICS